MPKATEPILLFLRHVEWSDNRFEGTRCLLWTGYRGPAGHGRFQTPERTPRQAHRWLWEHWFGPIPGGLQLHHRCHNAPCVNPSHLEPITASAHASKHAKDHPLWNRDHCKNGHPKNEVNSRRRKDGVLMCRVCERERKRRWKAKLRAAA